MAEKLLRFISSLKLTVVCLTFALILVFVGTIAQVQEGLYDAQARYFRSLLIWWQPTGGEFAIPVFPGGYLLGWVLLVNLLAAHYVRFKLSWSKLGINLTHAGLIFLLLGQFLTERLQTESNMRLEEGQSSNYSEELRTVELVLIDQSNPDHDEVIAIPEVLLTQGDIVAAEALPVRIKVETYFPNSDLYNRAPMVSTNPPASTQGTGTRIELFEAPITKKMNERNIPSAVVSFEGEGAPKGNWLVSPLLNNLQPVEIAGKTYQMGLRLTRHYSPYSLELVDFRHDKYLGTETAKNYSSRVILNDPTTGENRELTIKMNQPLRYAGTTYFQSSFEPGRDDVTILQVVKNPAWLTPYVSVIIIGLGLLIQFLMHLFKFATKRKTA